MVAVHHSMGRDEFDFIIRWFAQLDTVTPPEELHLNDSTTFGVRIDQPTIESGDFIVYKSQARISGMNIGIFDRFWCQIDASDTIKNTTNTTGLGRSEVTVVLEHDYYASYPLPLCPSNAFFHQTRLKCAESSQQAENGTLSEPPIVVPSSTPQTTPPAVLPASCSPPAFRERGGESSRLVSVLLPSLMLPIIVAILLVIAAVVMTCQRERSLSNKHKKKRRGECTL